VRLLVVQALLPGTWARIELEIQAALFSPQPSDRVPHWRAKEDKARWRVPAAISIIRQEAQSCSVLV